MNRKSFLLLTAKGTIGSLIGLSSISSLTGCAPKNDFRLQSPWVNDSEFIGYFIAEKNNYYREMGINHTYIPGGPEKISDNELLVKHAEMALTTPDVTINGIIQQNYPFIIIGTQYQKSPLGIVSLKENKIHTPKDLIGKTIAVPTANLITIKAFLKINSIQEKDVKIVPYQYDPTPLLNKEVDATLDFVTNVPFTIKEKGGDPTYFLLYDYGFQIFNDTVVVRKETLSVNSKMLTSWLKASRKGWEENFKDVTKYPKEFMNSYFKGTGRSLDNELYYNNAQKDLIESPNGIFSMSKESIKKTIDSLKEVGIDAKQNMFVSDII